MSSFLIHDHKMRKTSEKILKLQNFKGLKFKVFKPYCFYVFSDILAL